MKRNFLISLFLISSIVAFCQDITCEWNGLLKAGGMQLRVVFHITKTDVGYSATMDSPDQGAKDIPMSKTMFENRVLTVELDIAKINYTGTLDMDGDVKGTFTQGGQAFPLNLTHKSIEKVELKRPQNPVKPYPYYSEEITFDNKKENFTLAGTLTLPKKEGKFPVVVLITGSGPQNRDEELMGHKPFLVLSDYLTRNGIGVLRFDDRGTGASKGDFAKALTSDFATDVSAAVDYLETRKDIDAKKIGLIGHSEGGIVAPMVAVNRKDIRFIILMAGTAVSGGDILLLQQDLIGRATGVKEEDLKQTANINREIFDIITKSTNDSTLKTKLSDYIKLKIKEMPDVPKDAKEDDIVKQQLDRLTPWMLNFIKYNPAPMLEKVKCPVLAINGSKDMQVPSNVNLPAIENALKKDGNKKSTIKELPGLNHLFQECTTGAPVEYSQIEQTMSPVALETMANWIKQTIKQ